MNMHSDKPIGSNSCYTIPIPVTTPITSISNSIAVISDQRPMLLLDLPSEHLGHILGFLKYRDIKAVAQTCATLCSTIRSEHLLARTWFKQFSTKKQHDFAQIANNISNHELKAWLGQFTGNETLISHIYGYCAGEITDDGLSAREPRKGKYFPQILFYTVGRLMANCRAFHPELATSINFTPYTSMSTRLSNDARYLVTNARTRCGPASYDQAVKATRPIEIAIDHIEPFVNDFTFSADNQHILSRTNTTTKITGSNADGSWTERLTLRPGLFVRSATFNSDGHQAVTACGCKAIVCSMDKVGSWAATGTIIQEEDIRSANFSPDSSLIVTTSDDCTARIHGRDLNGKWQEQATLEHDGLVSCAVFSLDAKHILTLSGVDNHHCNQIVTIFSSKTDTGWTNKKVITHSQFINHVALSSDDRHVATASSDHTAIILSYDNTDNWQIKTTINHKGPVFCATFSPYCHYLATASDDKTAKIYRYNANARRWSQQQVIVHDKPIYSAAFSADDHHILTVSKNAEAEPIPGHNAMIHTRTTSNNWKTSANFAPQGGVHTANFNHDGSHVIINAANDYATFIYGYITEGSWIPKATIRHQYKLDAVTFSATSGCLMSISNEWQLVQVWHLYRPDLSPPVLCDTD
ncbi:F-box/WD repeat-containing protein [Endozoicomonas sp. ONNA2]|uniref:F-box/WD repeat-containing protein n=1 Tax=Endozoicomonas sp. ONNA2 TaxID=2828741 RepID=UPI0021487FD7|nr:F-box/WD repeat-containing protein [Endozoicomonas sp. ONNA2]